VGHKIPYEQHPYSFLGVNVSKSVYWQRGESARKRLRSSKSKIRNPAETAQKAETEKQGSGKWRKYVR